MWNTCVSLQVAIQLIDYNGLCLSSRHPGLISCYIHEHKPPTASDNGESALNCVNWDLPVVDNRSLCSHSVLGMGCLGSLYGTWQSQVHHCSSMMQKDKVAEISACHRKVLGLTPCSTRSDLSNFSVNVSVK